MKNYVIINTTSKKHNNNIRTIDKNVFGVASPSFISFDYNHVKSIIDSLDEHATVIADIEKKNDFSVYQAVKQNVDKHRVIDYKPNDLTVEAADYLITEHFEGDLSGYLIGVYGTGNLAFKIALKLIDRNAKVIIFGRNDKKIDIVCDALNQIKCTKSIAVSYKSFNDKLDGLISFINAEKVINREISNYMKESALIIDGGIGNFTSDMIEDSLSKDGNIIRLDTRLSKDILDGYIKSRVDNEFYNTVIGSDTIETIPVVAGGIIGEEGTVIIDKIVNPSSVIGIANGIGGVKNASELTDEEHKKIKKVQSHIEQGS